MNNRIMILGAGRGQVKLIEVAKELGYVTVVAGVKGNYPGIDIADEVCYIDISNPQEVCDAAKRLNVGGVATSCLDTGVPALGYTCEKLGLCGLSFSAAEKAGNKFLMKQEFAKCGVSTAPFRMVSDLDEFHKAVSEIGLPVIVKAVDLQGSRGITIVHTIEEATDAFSYTMSETRKDFCIVEKFIVGTEFGASAFVYNGEILFVLPTGDDTYTARTGVPVGHHVPCRMPEDVLRQADEQTRLAIEAIGFDNCAINVDLIESDGKVYVIEITGRMGANCLPELNSIYYGVDIYKMIADTAMGKDPRKYFDNRAKEFTAACSKMLISDKSGVLKRIENKNIDAPYINEITLFVKEGEVVNRFTNSKDCVGQIVVSGVDGVDPFAMVEDVANNIEFVLED